MENESNPVLNTRVDAAYETAEERERKAQVVIDSRVKMETMIDPNRKLPTLLPDRIGLAEHKRQDWVVQVGMDVKPNDLLDPAFWAHVAADFDSMDTVEVRWEDGSLIHHLRILWTEKTWARMKRVRIEDLGKIEPVAVEDNKFDVHWKGELKWCVIRKSDSVIVHQGVNDKATAAAWAYDQR